MCLWSKCAIATFLSLHSRFHSFSFLHFPPSPSLISRLNAWIFISFNALTILGNSQFNLRNPFFEKTNRSNPPSFTLGPTVPELLLHVNLYVTRLPKDNNNMLTLLRAEKSSVISSKDSLSHSFLINHVRKPCSRRTWWPRWWWQSWRSRRW